jgi:AraC family transcriptional regulator
LAKIAAAVDRALINRAETGCSGRPEARVLACGDGWSLADVVCASGPHDRRFEERHRHFSIAIVATGTFEYRAALGCDLMTPGSLMLGSPGQWFECGHEHGAGDRCIAFWYETDYFERLAADAGARGRRLDFRVLRLPPLRALAPLVARASAGITGRADVSWEELGIQIAARTVQLLADGMPHGAAVLPDATHRVAHIVRAIDRQPQAAMNVRRLARAAGLSPFHFLRTFERVTGVTPHQFVLRTRLREAARRLATEQGRILDVALDCGFGDVSNFNRTFRAEFGVSPRRFRAT